MKKIKLKKPRGVIVHPNDPDVQFVVERPTRGDILEFENLTKEFERYEVAINPNTKEPIRDKQGNPQVVNLPAIYPHSMVANHLRKYVKEVHGITDEEGNELDYKASEIARAKILASLIELELDVTRKTKVKQMKDGAEVEVEVDYTTPFLIYLIERLHNMETYNNDPLETGSTSRSNEDLEEKQTTAVTA